MLKLIIIAIVLYGLFIIGVVGFNIIEKQETMRKHYE